jgi:hypothetical protein
MTTTTTAFKTACLALTILLAGAASAPAVLLLYEGFDYDATKTNGTAIDGGSGGSGWTGAWDSPTLGAVRYNTTGLTYVNGGVLQVVGGTLQDTGTGGGPNLAATREIATAIDPDGTYWFSYLVAATEDDDSETRNWGLFASTSESNSTGFGTQMGVVSDDTISAHVGATHDATSPPTFAVDGTGQFVVGKVELSTTVDDVVSIWVNPALPNTEGSLGAPDSDVTATATLGSFFTYYLFPGQNDVTMIDEIRLGTTLADVVPIVGGNTSVPETSTLVMLVSGLLALGMLRRRRPERTCL